MTGMPTASAYRQSRSGALPLWGFRLFSPGNGCSLEKHLVGRVP